MRPRLKENKQTPWGEETWPGGSSPTTTHREAEEAWARVSGFKEDVWSRQRPRKWSYDHSS